VFNGGPGAASTYLHLGAMGPKIVEATDTGELIGPPSRLIPNDASWPSCGPGRRPMPRRRTPPITTKRKRIRTRGCPIH
jgi:hypothetical protein